MKRSAALVELLIVVSLLCLGTACSGPGTPDEPRLRATLQRWLEVERFKVYTPGGLTPIHLVAVGPIAPHADGEKDTIKLPFKVREEGREAVGDGTATFRKSETDGKWYLKEVEQGSYRLHQFGDNPAMVVE